MAQELGQPSYRDLCRAQIFQKRKIPRGKWLCANSAAYGIHSLHHYFRLDNSKPSCEQIWEKVKAMGQGNVDFNGESMFRADRSQKFGTSLRWIAFGQERPPMDVVTQHPWLVADESITPTEDPPPKMDDATSLAESPAIGAVEGRGSDGESGRALLLPAEAAAAGSSVFISPGQQPSEGGDLASTETSSFQARVGGRTTAEQTKVCFWSQGQLDALIMTVNALPKGSVQKIERTLVGLCEKLVLHLKGGPSNNITVYSAERVGPKQLHPNLRYQAATLTAPGFSPESARRIMNELGCAGAPDRKETRQKRIPIMEEIKRIGQLSMHNARLEKAEEAFQSNNTKSINGTTYPSRIFNSDGNGSKRSYNNYHTGEGVSTALVIDDKVVDCEYKQNNDRDNQHRNHAGSVATAETAAMRDMGKRQLSHSVPIHVEFLAADGDASVCDAMRSGQRDAGIPEDCLTKSMKVICHEIKNFDRKLLDFTATNLTAKCNITAGRVKAIGCDIRRLLIQCNEKLQPCDTLEAEVAVLTEFREVHLPQVINHHCGECEGCSSEWCEHKKIFEQFPDLSVTAQEARYFGLGENRGSRFTCFIDISDDTRQQLKDIVKKRYTIAALRALTTTIVDNNNVERLWTHLVKFNQGKRLNCTQGGTGEAHLFMAVCEVNDGLTWLGELDEVLGLKSLARDGRAAMQRKRDKDKARKQTSSYIDRRKMRKKYADLRQGKPNKGGWKQGVRPYRSNSVAPGQVSRAPVKRRAPSSSAKEKNVCNHCLKHHATRSCCCVKRQASTYVPRKKDESANKYFSGLLAAASRTTNKPE